MYFFDDFGSLKCNKLVNRHVLRPLLSSSSSETPSSSFSSSSSLVLFSPSKINLFLRIIEKRPDNFHELASLFSAIGLGDTLSMSSSQTDTFACNMPGVPTDSSNLVVRAINLVREKTNMEHVKFSVDLDKTCPAQAGLGGGSGNAATAMWGCNELLGKPATIGELVEWSGELGSDITFFLSNGQAYCTGRGEIIENVEMANGGGKVTVVKINQGLSTPEVFRNLKYDNLSPASPTSLLESFTTLGPYKVPQPCYVNDLQEPAFACLPKLKELVDELKRSGFDTVMMSGSGTSVFCLGKGGGEKWEKIKGRKDVQVWETEFVKREDGGWYER